MVIVRGLPTFTGKTHYHRPWVISLLCSKWEQVEQTQNRPLTITIIHPVKCCYAAISPLVKLFNWVKLRLLIASQTFQILIEGPIFMFFKIKNKYDLLVLLG